MDPLERLVSAEITRTRERPVFGLVTARVTRILDNNTYEVAYLDMADDEPSSPARVMMPMAGNGRGTYFHPLVGDEVVVGFEGGDTNQPIILGGVWNEDDRYPDQARPSPDNDVRAIVTRSGHELTFDDAPGREKVTLRSQGGHVLELDDLPGRGKITLSTAGGRTVVLDDTPAGSITLRTPTGAEVSLSDAGGRITISAPLQITLQSPVISLSGNVIQLTTTGTPTASMVMIDGMPFGMHKHFVAPALPAPPTGPVFPT